jgi:CheY-like chemotaxis protein
MKKERMKEGIVKREIRVLIGSFEPNFDYMFSTIIRRRLGGEYELSFMTAGYGEDLLKLAEEHSFDIFILVTNNILFKRKNVTIKDRGRKVLEIIAHLRATYEKPIIAASAFWTKDTPFAKGARNTGVSCYLDMPFKPEEFLESFCYLMEIEPDGDN